MSLPNHPRITLVGFFCAPDNSPEFYYRRLQVMLVVLSLSLIHFNYIRPFLFKLKSY